MKITNENWLNISLISVLLSIGVIFYYRNYMLEKKHVYIIAKYVKGGFEGSEMGWMYNFYYFYNDKKFDVTFGGPLKKYISKDSLLLIKVSRSKPSISKPAFQVIPFCIDTISILRKSWDTLPVCSSPDNSLK